MCSLYWVVCSPEIPEHGSHFLQKYCPPHESVFLTEAIFKGYGFEAGMAEPFPTQFFLPPPPHPQKEKLWPFSRIWVSCSIQLLNEGRHCCSVGELKITFASTCNHGCKESVFNVLFNVLFLVLDFPLGAPNTLLKHVIEGSIWRIVVGEGSWWGWGFSQDWWLGFWSCWSLSLTAVFWIDFSVACFKRV